MKILLATLNSKYIHASLAPWYLYQGIIEYGHENIHATVKDYTINQDEDFIINDIIEQNYAIVCFSIYIWNITKTLDIIQKIKAINPQLIIIVGGPEVSFNAENIIQNPDINYVLRKHGEESLPSLINAIMDGGPLDDISGLTYISNNEIINNKIVPLKRYLNPYSQKFIDNVDNRIVYIETSRGCPFQCAFCLSGYDDKPCFFDYQTSLDNIVKLSHCGTKTIKFVDRTFNANRKRAKDIWSFIINDDAVNKDVTYHFEIAGDIIDQESLDILSKAPCGLIQFEIGLQSFNNMTLDAVFRKTNIDKLVHNIEALLKLNNMHIHIDLIAGLPYEDYASFKNSFNIAYNLKPHMLQLGFLKLIYGSYLRDNYTDFGYEFDANPPYQIIKSKWISNDELSELSKVEDLLDRMYNSGRFINTLNYLLSKYHNSAFEMFEYMSKNIEYQSKIDLDLFIELIYNLYNHDEYLKDCLIYDRILMNKSGKIPLFLKDDCIPLKRYRLALDKIIKSDGTKRGFEYLKSIDSFIYCDYKEYDLINSRYIPKIIKKETLDISNI